MWADLHALLSPIEQRHSFVRMHADVFGQYRSRALSFLIRIDRDLTQRMNPAADSNANRSASMPVERASSTAPTRTDYIAWAGLIVAMLLVFELRLLSALIAGLLVHELVHALAGRLHGGIFNSGRAKQAAALLIAVMVIVFVAVVVFGAAVALRHGSIGLPELFQKLAEIIDNSRVHLPQSVLDSLPNDADDLRHAVVGWLREHSATVQGVGEKAVRISAHILIGMVLGALLALREGNTDAMQRPLTAAIAGFTARLATAFRRVALAQTWIAALNALFTWLYIGVALPIAGVHLPLTKSLIALTFVAGLIPILGNLVSNSVIVVVSLNESLAVAMISLAFLIAVHKLGYFLNARIVGSRIHAQAWEILLAMLIMESAFGLPGVVAAPIFYAFLKQELASKRLI
jgi:predicted PurR-regulated permease PerM